MTKELTIKEFSEIIQQDYLATTALVKLMVSVGAAKEIGNKSIPGQRGKPSKMYEIWPEFSVDFWQEPEQGDVVETAPVAEVIP